MVVTLAQRVCVPRMLLLAVASGPGFFLIATWIRMSSIHIPARLPGPSFHQTSHKWPQDLHVPFTVARDAGILLQLYIVCNKCWFKKWKKKITCKRVSDAAANWSNMRPPGTCPFGHAYPLSCS